MYFNKRRALANGICVSGTAAGSFVFPILIEYLIHKFGFHGTLLLLGAGMLHVCVSATLYRPFDTNCPSDSTKTTKCENSSNSTATNLTLLTSSNGDAKRYIEHLFMEESKNRLNDLYNTNKLGEFFSNLFFIHFFIVSVEALIVMSSKYRIVIDFFINQTESLKVKNQVEKVHEQI